MTALELCRLCANLADVLYSRSLFEQDQQELLQQVEQLTGLQLQLQNAKDLPQHICITCQAQTLQAHEFRERCIRAQEQFTSAQYLNPLKHGGNDGAENSFMEEYEFLSENDDYQPNDDYDDVESKESSNGDEPLGNICNLATDASKEADAENHVYPSDAHCGLVIETMPAKKVHLERPKVGLLFTCNHCSKRFCSQQECTRHTHTHTVERPWVCKQCDCRFLYKRGLRQHIRRKHTKEELLAMTKTDAESRTYICEQCGKYFSAKCKLTLHMNRHKGKKSYPCGLCPKGYYTKTELTIHMYTHTGELPYPCKYCDRRFNSRSHLLRHTRSHTNERPFVCKYCGKGFTSSNIHKSHLLTHTGVRAFDCVLCNVSFKRKTNLVSHNRTKSHKRIEENQQVLEV